MQLDELGHVNLDSLEDLLKNNKKSLVSLMAVNNEIGNVLDVDTVSKLCKKYGALFHSDTVQLMGHSKIDFAAMDVDFAACSAHKFHGPKGAGFMFKRKGINIKPMITGGGQEGCLRAGTENIGGIAGQSAALMITDSNRERDSKHISSIKQEFVRSIREEFPEVLFNGDVDGRSSSSIVNFALPLNPEREEGLIAYLNEKGVYVSAGSACNGNALSYVLQEVGHNSGKENVRVSFGRNNNLSEVEVMIELLLDYYR